MYNFHTTLLLGGLTLIRVHLDVTQLSVVMQLMLKTNIET